MRRLRHLVAIALLPFVVTIVVPLWIAPTNDISLRIGDSVLQVLFQLLGVGVVGVGLLLFVTSLQRFATEGEGTLAPWDPPRNLVVRGPYRYVRNPMISGVILILFGESLVLLSWPHFMWAAAFVVVNAVYIPLFEEPQLANRFGVAYATYRRHVPRLIPRWRPWEPASSERGSA